jgi:hypothetical protein
MNAKIILFGLKHSAKQFNSAGAWDNFKQGQYSQIDMAILLKLS